MKKLLAVTAASLLIGCVYSMPEKESRPSYILGEVEIPCQPSCILAWKHVNKQPLPPGDSVKYAQAKGDTLMFYLGETEDGREWGFREAEFDSLQVGDRVPTCNMDPEIACWVEP